MPSELISAPKALTTTTTSTWWRWPLLPFGALAAGFVAGLVVTGVQWLGVMMNWGSTEGWYWLYLVPISVSAVFGYVFALTSWTIAPKSKFTATTVMVTLPAVLCVADIVIVWFLWPTTVGHAIQSTLQSGVSTIAAVGFLIGAHTDSTAKTL